RVSSINASGSHHRSNTKNDTIQRTSSRSKKNKVEAQRRKCNIPKSGWQRNVEYPRALLHRSIAQDMKTTTNRVV
nr:hypothetical protein [Tanacetum cinerariifolium]